MPNTQMLNLDTMLASPEVEANLIGIQLIPNVTTTQLTRPISPDGTLARALSGNAVSYHDLTINHKNNAKMATLEDSLYGLNSGYVSYIGSATLFITSTYAKVDPSGEAIAVKAHELVTITFKSDPVELLGEYPTAEQLTNILLHSTSITYSEVIIDDTEGMQIVAINSNYCSNYVNTEGFNVLSADVAAHRSRESSEMSSVVANIQQSFTGTLATANGGVDALRNALHSTHLARNVMTDVRLLSTLMIHENPATSAFSLQSLDQPNILITLDGENKCTMHDLISVALVNLGKIASNQVVENTTTTKMVISPVVKFASVTDIIQQKSGTSLAKLSGATDTSQVEAETAAVEELSRYISDIVLKFGMASTLITIDTAQVSSSMSSVAINITDLNVAHTSMSIRGITGIAGFLSFIPNGMIDPTLELSLIASRQQAIETALREALQTTMSRFVGYKLKLSITDMMLFDLYLPMDNKSYKFIHSFRFTENCPMVIETASADTYLDNMAAVLAQTIEH